MAQSASQEDPIFNNDVLYMKSLIGKSVSIETVDKCTHQGTVFVIDPVFKTVVLTNKSTNTLEFVLHHAIRSLSVLSEVQKEEILDIPISVCNVEEMQHNKTRLVKWLKQLLINVREDGELIRVDEHFSIGPPYGKDDCMCENTIVLERIRKIIDLMPAEFE